MSQSGILEIAHDILYWPSPEKITTPSGVGPSIYAQLAQEKLGKNIARECPDGAGVEVGILAANPEGDDTEAPLAIVCDFNRPISQATLAKTYNLAWSFSRSQALITLEPHLARVWTCCETPTPLDKADLIEPVITISKQALVSSSIEHQAASALLWIEWVSGRFFQKHDDRFRKNRAADQMLLKNLKSVRRQLKELGLSEDIIHDLLARLMFIQFLFHRKDSSGKSALDENFLKKIHKENILSTTYCNLSEILSNHNDTYSFFRLLNSRFNGDLFPGKGASEEERKREWMLEEQEVTQPHLNLLGDFVAGNLRMDDGQYCLWPFYSFDAMPLDFISSIYEEFISEQKKSGAHYTPGHIVNFVLDNVLPWKGDDWNIKILDPACGSGIFLVKAFQRLIYRWKNSHPGEEVKAKILKSMLENNIFGVDINEHAVRVASFSLYLTMCDAIDPIYYWKTVKFPRLREQNLINSDFFKEDRKRIRSNADAKTYDLIIGNAPWGRNSLTPAAKEWSSENKWDTTYGNVGPLFLPKSAILTKPNGQVAMMQPAGILIFSQKEKSKAFRKRLFSEYKINEIVNLSALRFGLFKNSISPSCVITLTASSPDNDAFFYICPKPSRYSEDDYRIAIEPNDINSIYPHEGINDPLTWTALMWGGMRDLALVRRLRHQKNLGVLKEQGSIATRQGIIRTDKKKRQESIIGRRILNTKRFPENTILYLKAEELPVNKDPLTHSRDSTDYTAFEIPQLILKQSFQQENKRFQAALVQTDEDEGVLCSTGYVSVHASKQYQSILETACLTYNSKLAVYYLLLSSGSFASYIPKINVEDLIAVPLPEKNVRISGHIESFDLIDASIREAFMFKDGEWALIEDLFDYTLPDFKGDSNSSGRQKTFRSDKYGNAEPTLKRYCECFIRVLKAGFGQDKQICATIFQEHTPQSLPIRLVAFYLNRSNQEGVRIESIASKTLLRRLDMLNQSFIEQGYQEGLYYQRTARIYTSTEIEGQKTPTIYFAKPDKIRYWTRSMALRDADEVATDVMFHDQKS